MSLIIKKTAEEVTERSLVSYVQEKIVGSGITIAINSWNIKKIRIRKNFRTLILTLTLTNKDSYLLVDSHIYILRSPPTTHLKGNWWPLLFLTSILYIHLLLSTFFLRKDPEHMLKYIYINYKGSTKVSIGNL